MYSIRVASLCFVIALAFAPVSAHAQERSLNARVAALEAAVAKLRGNITASDLVGTYAFYLIGISMDPPGTVATYNDMSSYVATGTVTLTATTATSGTGTLNGIIDGIELTEQAPSANWTWAATPIGGIPQATALTWTYDRGTRTLSMQLDTGLSDFDLSVAAGGQVLVSVHGGTPDNNQQLIVLTRK